jgi:hypothetical protein
MRRITKGAAMLLCAISAGACTPSHDLETCSLITAMPSPTLLFDARPGALAADTLIYRGDWPSAESAFSLGETIYYEEYFNDQQFLWPRARDYTTRQFRTYRSGAAAR